MTTYSTNELKSGVKIMIDNNPCNIIESEFFKPGKGQAVYRIKYRNLKTGNVLEKTFKTGESVSGADVVEKELQYLYNDGDLYYFMDSESFEQYSISVTAMGDVLKWIKEQDLCTITLWNDDPISVTPPIFVTLAVTQTDPGLKGDTASGGSKPATLEMGAIVKVPLFINEGDMLKIDTRTGEYVSRIKV